MGVRKISKRQYRKSKLSKKKQYRKLKLKGGSKRKLKLSKKKQYRKLKLLKRGSKRKSKLKGGSKRKLKLLKGGSDGSDDDGYGVYTKIRNVTIQSKPFGMTMNRDGYIKFVKTAGAAEAAGLKQGMYIRKFDGDDWDQDTLKKIKSKKDEPYNFVIQDSEVTLQSKPFGMTILPNGLISGVTPNGHADEAGLEMGMYIRKYQGDDWDLDTLKKIKSNKEGPYNFVIKLPETPPPDVANSGSGVKYTAVDVGTSGTSGAPVVSGDDRVPVDDDDDGVLYTEVGQQGEG